MKIPLVFAPFLLDGSQTKVVYLFILVFLTLVHLLRFYYRRFNMKNLRKIFILVLLVVLTATLSLFAVACKGKQAKLSFETNGAEAIETVKIDKETAYTLPVPARGEDYSFEGWYLSEDFSGSAVTEVTLSENTTVYAKWEKLYAVTLDLSGGSLSTTKLYLKKGASVYDAVSTLTPTKSGFRFGAWFNGKAEVAKNLKMSDSDMTLTAKFKAPYTVEVYKQKATLDGYDVESEVYYEYIGNTVDYTGSVNGFTEVLKADTLKSLVINEVNPSIKVYYDRNKVSVSFNPNYPDGSLSESTRVETYYGAEIANVDDYYFECAGYYLKGWATSQNGEIVYKSNFINRAVGDTDVKSDSIVAERSMILYAVWEKGYSDMFGGEDYIFVEPSEGRTSTVYLNRGTYYFKGTFYNNSEPKTYNFVFKINSKKELFGKTNSNGTFVYIDDTRKNYTSSLFVQGTGVESNTTLKFDSANGVTYSESGTEKGKGTYLIDENGMFVITYTEGELQGQTMNVVIGTVSNQNVFQIRDEEEYAMGKLVRFGVSGSALGTFKAYQIELSGFGTAKYYTDEDGEEYSSYYYTRDGETITLLNSKGATQGVLKLMTYNGTKGYMFYNEVLDRKVAREDGTWLSVDGLYNLTYFDGTSEQKGVYTYATSVFGGYILSTSLNGQAAKFLVSYHTESSVEDGGDLSESTTVTVYEFAKKLSTYAEYYYSDNGNIYYAPLIVIDDEKQGWASLYGYTLQKTYEKVAEGPYTLQEVVSEATNVSVYNFTVDTRVDPAPDVSATVYDITTIKSIVFVLDPQKATNYNISYWYQVVTTDDETHTYNDVYTDQSGNTIVLVGTKDPSVSKGTLTISGIAIYTGGGSVVTGAYTEQFTASSTTLTDDEVIAEHNVATYCYLGISTSSGYIYAELDHTNHTFLKLDHTPYNLYRYKTDGSGDAYEYIALDGKGGAEYTLIETDDDGNETGRTTINGKVTSTDLSSKFGSPIYSFTSDTVNFKFIQLSSSSYYFFSKYEYDDANCNGKEYVNAKYGTLVLDGFGYGATYTEISGTAYNGRYLLSENMVTLATSAGYRYFDVTGTSFTARGTEYGGSANSAYILFDNQRVVGEYIHFDGYGNAKIFKYENVDGSSVQVYIDKNATYTVSGDVITIKFTNDGDDLVYVGKISTFTYSSYTYRTFELQRENSIVKAYVNNSDWTVLILDDVGKAIRYQDRGTRETGTYKLITDNLLYYVNDASTDACLYSFDTETGEIVLCNTLPYNYYTEDLNTLIFTKYGFVTQNGSSSYYYTVDDNDFATIYEYDDDNPDANDYGFVARDFGTFDDVKTFEGETYYQSSGYALKFARTDDNKGKYPVNGYEITSIEFSPVGGATYSVSATITLVKEATEEGAEDEVKTLSGYVVKTEEETYLALSATVGQYRFPLDITYKGAGKSAYAINGMRYVASVYSFTYLYSNLIYILLGYSVPNTYGTMSILTEYAEDGTATANYITGEFGESSGYVDSKGNLLTFADKQEYTYDESTSVYTVAVTMADGYDYELRFQLTSVYGISCYRTIGFLRNETLSYGKYTVKAQRVIASDYYTKGSYYDVRLTVDGTQVDYTEAYIVNGVITYIVREFDETNGVVSSSTHYTIALTEKTSESVGEEEEVTVNGVVPFEKVTVTETKVSTYYTEDKDKFVEIANDEVLTIVTQKVAESGKVTYSSTLVKTCEKTGDNTYTVTTRAGKTYTVAIANDVVSVTEVVEAEETQE